MNDIATVSHNAIYSVPLGYAHAYLVEGEELTINQLLHLLLIPSANDAAYVLAEHIAGSVESFSTMMNTKALEIGCKNTHFVNPNGIHSKDHYTTAYDLALIGRYAMKFDAYRDIVKKTKYTLPATNKYPEANRFFKLTNELVVPDERDSADNYYYKYANGIKTGYTVPAGDCIVASAKKDDLEFIVVILGAEKLENGLSARYTDCKNLFNYAFDNFRTKTIIKKDTILKQLQISNGNIFNNTLDLIVQDDITVAAKKTSLETNLTPTLNVADDLTAPISKNSVIGTISYTIDGTTYTSSLLAGNDIQESNLKNTVLTILSIAFVLFILIRLSKSNKKSKKRCKRKNTKKRNNDNYMYW